MNACLFSTAFKSSSLFLIKTESILQTVKVDFFSCKLHLALDTLIGLGFEVASERVFFLGLAKVFFLFRSWVPSLYWLSGRCREFCTGCLGDVNSVVESIGRGQFGSSWNFWEATWSCRRGEVWGGGEVRRRDIAFGEAKCFGGGIWRKENVDGVHVHYWDFILLKKVKHVFVKSVSVSSRVTVCYTKACHGFVYNINRCIFLEIFGYCRHGFIHFTGSRRICLRVTFI